MAFDQAQLPKEIQETIQREANVKDVQFSNDAHLLLYPSEIIVRMKGRSYQGKLNRPLLHQLASRLWPQVGQERDPNAEYAEYKRRWTLAMKEDPKQLECSLRDVLLHERTVMRVLPIATVGQIYGLVSTRFVKMDQGEVYKELQQALQSDARLRELFGVEEEWDIDNFGRPCLSFNFRSPEKRMEVGLKANLSFGLNNGYSAYAAEAKRYVLICTNGLTRDEQAFQWKHNRQQSIHTFIEAFVERGFHRLAWTQGHIEARRGTPLQKTSVNELLQRLNLAAASKERIKARLRHEINETGANEWSLSQSLTWLGTHEKAINKRPRSYLRLAGTFVLDRSLDTFLQEESGEFQTDGFYASPLLPR